MDDDDDNRSLSSLSDLTELSSDDDVVTDGILVSKAASTIKGDDRTNLRKVTAVPHPKTTLLKPSARSRRPGKRKSSKRTLCKRQQHQRLLAQIEHDLQYWAKEAPVYRLAGVSLEKLQSRTKNAPKDKAQAREMIKKMESWESDGASGIFEDEVGNTLVAYFGRRVKAEVKVSPR